MPEHFFAKMVCMNKTTLDQLKRRGHAIGTTGVTHKGKMIINIDGRMLTYPEINQILADDLEKERNP